jgi:hypothetical protein
MPTVVIPEPPTAPGRTKVFFASGRMARTIMSCDGGNTWINDRSQDENARCWLQDQTDPRYVECDHNPYAGVGIDSGDGWLFANFGWGYAGSVRRSRDGVNWDILRSDNWGGGVAYALGRLFLAWGSWFTSDDIGMTWSPVQNPNDNIVYDHPLARRLRDKIILLSRTNGVIVSSDGGKSWSSPQTLSGFNATNAVEGNGIDVAIGVVNNSGTATNNGFAARSIDGGKTWSSRRIWTADNASWNQIVFNGTEFVSWADGKAWKSTDGANWTSTPMTTTSTLYPTWWMAGPTAYNSDTKTYALVMDQWQYWYDKQRAYRSTDGVNWIELDASHFQGGHPIGAMTVGEIDSQYCP